MVVMRSPRVSVMAAVLALWPALVRADGGILVGRRAGIAPYEVVARACVDGCRVRPRVVGLDRVPLEIAHGETVLAIGQQALDAVWAHLRGRGESRPRVVAALALHLPEGV